MGYDLKTLKKIGYLLQFPSIQFVFVCLAPHQNMENSYHNSGLQSLKFLNCRPYGYDMCIAACFSKNRTNRYAMYIVACFSMNRASFDFLGDF